MRVFENGLDISTRPLRILKSCWWTGPVVVPGKAIGYTRQLYSVYRFVSSYIFIEWGAAREVPWDTSSIDHDLRRQVRWGYPGNSSSGGFGVSVVFILVDILSFHPSSSSHPFAPVPPPAHDCFSSQ
jgi:hypothetical protein